MRHELWYRGVGLNDGWVYVYRGSLENCHRDRDFRRRVEHYAGHFEVLEVGGCSLSAFSGCSQYDPKMTTSERHEATRLAPARKWSEEPSAAKNGRTVNMTTYTQDVPTPATPTFDAIRRR
jgi:hypothetical protein